MKQVYGYMTREEAAKLLRVDVRTISRYVKAKKIEAIKYGRKMLIAREQFEEEAGK
jgi:excisionase family DNA binding protein